MASIKYWVWLSSLTGLGSRAVASLLNTFGDPENIYFAPFGAYDAVEGLSFQEIDLLNNKDLAQAEKILSICEEKQIRILTRQDADYPARLAHIYDAPAVLYIRGRLPYLDESPVIALVGTRKATPYGIKTADNFGFQLAKGGAITCTGMALGIDAAAAHGTLMGGGKCVGVLGCAIDIDYPAQNSDLIKDVAATGCIISEYPPESKAMNFPRRNRIISGLSTGVCIIEAPRKSGALITASFALEQGRDIFAVPCNIDSPSGAGGNSLLREGATIVLSGADILEEYDGRYIVEKDKATKENPYPVNKNEFDKSEAVAYIDLKSIANGCTPDQTKILEFIGKDEKQVDEIIAHTSFSAAKVLAELTLLSIRGKVTVHPGKKYSLKIT